MKFSNRYFDTYGEVDFARSGCTVSEEVNIPAGVVMKGDVRYPANCEPMLRSLGMPTLVKDGCIYLHSPYTICKSGDTLTVNQAHLLVSDGAASTFKCIFLLKITNALLSLFVEIVQQ